MALWLARGGRSGEHEQRMLDESKIFLSWGGRTAEKSLESQSDWEGIRSFIESNYPDWSPGKVSQNASQFWVFRLGMKPKDLVALPRKGSGVVAFGKITSEYRFVANAPALYRHERSVEWLRKDVQRDTLDDDLLNSLGAFTTFCEIKRNNLEERVRAMLEGRAAPRRDSTALPSKESDADYEGKCRREIAEIIERRFGGHKLARLIEGLLKAQGHTTHLSPKGPDKGVDILAAPGTLGFGTPWLCVQVKSGDVVADQGMLNELMGVMSSHQAEHGLLVAWGGFTTAVHREKPSKFFKVRLWNRDDILDAIFENYLKLDAGLRAELPLKQIWMYADSDETEE